MRPKRTAWPRYRKGPSPMLSFFWKCLNCAESVTRLQELPLCSHCQAHFPPPAPALCPQCAGLSCTSGPCQMTWRGGEHFINSFGAMYLLVEPGYSLLKCWKRRGGPLLDRKILSLAHLNLSKIPRCDAITFIPQRFQRSWKLGRCPAEIFAQWNERDCIATRNFREV